EGIADDGVGSDEARVAGVVEAAFHVDEPELVVMLMAGEAVRGVSGGPGQGSAVGVDALPVGGEVERCGRTPSGIEGGGEAAEAVSEGVVERRGVWGAGDDLGAVAVSAGDVVEVCDGTARAALFVEAANRVGDRAAVRGFDPLPKGIVGEGGGVPTAGDSA